MPLDLLAPERRSAEGPLSRWLRSLGRPPRIAWYPSAGGDFRDLLYLSPAYRASHPLAVEEPALPDLFLHTDHWPFDPPGWLPQYGAAFSERGDACFPSGASPPSTLVFSDTRTRISVLESEELARIDLPVPRELVSFSEPKPHHGRALFLWVEVQSERFGRWQAPLIFAFVENTGFCVDGLLTSGRPISHVIHVRYGGGFGGSLASGAWLRSVLGRLGCEYFINDGTDREARGDAIARRIFHTLSSPSELGPTQTLRTVASRSWSNHGDVAWQVRLK